MDDAVLIDGLLDEEMLSLEELSKYSFDSPSSLKTESPHLTKAGEETREALRLSPQECKSLYASVYKKRWEGDISRNFRFDFFKKGYPHFVSLFSVFGFNSNPNVLLESPIVVHDFTSHNTYSPLDDEKMLFFCRQYGLAGWKGILEHILIRNGSRTRQEIERVIRGASDVEARRQVIKFFRGIETSDFHYFFVEALGVPRSGVTLQTSLIDSGFETPKSMADETAFHSSTRLRIRSEPPKFVVIPVQWTVRKSTEWISHAVLVYIDMEQGTACLVDPNGDDAEYGNVSSRLSSKDYVKRRHPSMKSYTNYAVLSCVLEYVKGVYGSRFRIVFPEMERIHITRDDLSSFEEMDAVSKIKAKKEDQLTGYCTYFTSFLIFNLMCTTPRMERMTEHLSNLGKALVRKEYVLSKILRLVGEERVEEATSAAQEISLYLALLYVRVQVNMTVVSFVEFMQAFHPGKRIPKDMKKMYKHLKTSQVRVGFDSLLDNFLYIMFPVETVASLVF